VHGVVVEDDDVARHGLQRHGGHLAHLDAEGLLAAARLAGVVAEFVGATMRSGDDAQRAGHDSRPPTASPELKQVLGHAPNPESAAFWRSRPENYVMQFIGHYVKYPYAFLTLEAKATDAGIKVEARRRLHWILDPRSPR
jgi:hypothetical protein